MLPALPMASERRRAPGGAPDPMNGRKAHGTPRLRAARYGVSGTSAAFSSCSNRGLLGSKSAYRLSISETRCAAVDFAFSEAPKYLVNASIPQAINDSLFAENLTVR